MLSRNASRECIWIVVKTLNDNRIWDILLARKNPLKTDDLKSYDPNFQLMSNLRMCHIPCMDKKSNFQVKELNYQRG